VLVRVPPRLPAPAATQPRRIAWIEFSGLAACHFLALFAFVRWLFSWTGVMLAVLGLHIFGTVGINLCYHRLLNHCGVVCPKTVSAIVSQEVRKCGRAAAPRPNMWYKRLIPEFATHCGDFRVYPLTSGRLGAGAVAGRRAIGTSVPVRAGIELQPLPQAHQHGQARCRNGRSQSRRLGRLGDDQLRVTASPRASRDKAAGVVSKTTTSTTKAQRRDMDRFGTARSSPKHG
jgi:hypothetical protein